MKALFRMKKPTVGTKCSREVGVSASGHKITCPLVAFVTVTDLVQETVTHYCSKHFTEFMAVQEVKVRGS